MRMQIESRLRSTEKFRWAIIILLLITISSACRKEIPANTESRDTSVNSKITFQKTYDPPSSAIACEFNHVQPTKDGGYILAGGVCDAVSGWWDTYLLKTNSRGETIWDKRLGVQNDIPAGSVFETSDNGFIVIGGFFPDVGNY